MKSHHYTALANAYTTLCDFTKKRMHQLFSTFLSVCFGTLINYMYFCKRKAIHNNCDNNFLNKKTNSIRNN